MLGGGEVGVRGEVYALSRVMAVFYGLGYSTTQLGEMFGVTQASVSRRLRKVGVVMRPVGVPARRGGRGGIYADRGGVS